MYHLNSVSFHPPFCKNITGKRKAEHAGDDAEDEQWYGDVQDGMCAC